MTQHKKLKLLQIIGLALVVLGLLGMLPLLYFRYQLSRANAVPVQPMLAQPATLKPETVTGKPTKLQVPSVGVDVAVADGAYDNSTKQWTLSLDKAHFATITTPPNNEEGNTYIYGHYRPGVFATLHNIKLPAKAIVSTDNGYRFTYQFEGSKVISPADTSIFAYKGKPILTLQTCTGLWFQNREQFTFRLVSYEKI